MCKKSFFIKKILSSTIVLALILIFSSILPAYAYSNDNMVIPEKINNTRIVKPSAIGGLQQYYPDRPYQENSIIVTQFTGNKLTLSASATPGSLGYSYYVIIRIKQRDALGIMQTIYSGTVNTDGFGKLIIGSRDIKAYEDLQITADVRSYNGLACTANVAISASSSN